MSVNFVTDESYEQIPSGGIHRNFVKLSDNTLIHFFKSSGLKAVYSTDNGVTWSSSSSIISNTDADFDIYKRKDDAIFLVYDSGYPGVIYLRKITFDGSTFTVGSANSITVGTDLFTVDPRLFIRETDSQIFILFRRQISSGETYLSYVTTDDEGATFSSKTNIEEIHTSFAVFYQANIQSSDDYPFVVYVYANKAYSLYYNGSVWSSPVQITDSGDNDGSDISLTKTDNNDVFLSIGQSSYTTGYTRVYKYSSSSWSSPLFERLNGGFNFNSFTPLITTDGTRIYLMYANASKNSIVLNVLDGGDTEFKNVKDIYISDSGSGKHTLAGVLMRDSSYLYVFIVQSGTYDTYFYVSDVSIVLNKDVKKRFIHKVYNRTGAYVCTWEDEVMNNPSFNWKINGGMGVQKITLARPLTDFGEEVDVALNFRVKTFIQGKDETLGTQIFDGIITSYVPKVNDNNEQSVDVYVVSQTVTLQNELIKSGSDTTIAYASQDPSTILKDLIDKYAGTIDYTDSSVETTGTTVTYTFQYQSYMDSINKILEMCPSYWYWYVDGLSNIYLRSRNLDVVNHELIVGKHITEISAEKSIDNLFNAVYFKGGGSPPLYKLYSRTTSQTTYGKRDKKIQDERVTVAGTAETIATRFLDEKDHPISVTTVKVIDNSISDDGYDIESLRVGDVVKVIHPKFATDVTLWDVAMWDVDFWDYNVIYTLGIPSQIISIQYNFDHAILELSSQIEDVEKRIEDINRNLDNVRSEDIPTAPS